MQDWKYEREWRLLVQGKIGIRKIGTVTEMLLGAKCPIVVDDPDYFTPK